ncbi:DUF6624 domain-containing protein [Sphingomonas abietis]|uniref:DUF4034 domain-containing protein n=1 Tax=Sphingomonas abietis TaxID=3012344 RepID=A0ABY7NP48_9SPHN|nr:DUF6624 domain-containing protein [Sphingomonas abietis]WBO22357.1 hypothetical protein PBT88_19825 [Sphingomonas abietis]
MRLLPLVLSLLTIAAAPPPASTPPPSQIAAHVKDGHFDPGDYGWTRGAFPGATAQQAADWKAIDSFAVHCADDAPHDEAALKALGYDHAPADYWRRYAGDVCGEAMMARHLVEGFKDWTVFRHALDTALPAYRTYLFAVNRAIAIAAPDEGDLRDQLHILIIPDQMLREALSWGQGSAADAPPLDPDARRIVSGLLWPDIRRQDHSNTAWLKDEIAQHGWPTISQVGKLAARNAWLLVQHADDDPLFQLRVLRLMEPLVAKGEVDQESYALLTDRVLLPLTGKQRYGTQFTCDSKGWHPLDLEDPDHVDARRTSLGMSSIADNKARMIRLYGAHCRP